MSVKCGSCDCADKSQCTFRNLDTNFQLATMREFSYHIGALFQFLQRLPSSKFKNSFEKFYKIELPRWMSLTYRFRQKGSSYVADIVETEKSFVSFVEMDVPAAENDGKCKCGTSCACTNCTCGGH